MIIRSEPALDNPLLGVLKTGESVENQTLQKNQKKDVATMSPDESDSTHFGMSRDFLWKAVRYDQFLTLLRQVWRNFKAAFRGTQASPPSSGNALHLYLDLMERCLTDLIYAPDHEKFNLQGQLFDERKRIIGKEWPLRAHTMIGVKRLKNIKFCVSDALASGVQGDLIEAGVWRGGAAIFMRAILRAHNITDRNVWVADSFEGLPPPNTEEYPADAGDKHHQFKELAVSMEQVMSNFSRYNLLDDQVKFLKGWFKDTLPRAPIKKLAVIRLDGDMYGSTIEALNALYPKLSIGGYIIIDDYGAVEGCKKAVHDYREQHGINGEIIPIDWTGVYWRKT